MVPLPGGSARSNSGGAESQRESGSFRTYRIRIYCCGPYPWLTHTPYAQCVEKFQIGFHLSLLPGIFVRSERS